MAHAIRLALDNVVTGRGGPFGALVVRDSKIMGEGTNLVTTMNDPTAHAEIIAIRNACRTLNSFQLTGCDIYTTCEPCPMCLGAIYWSRADRIFFAGSREDAASAGFDDEWLYREFAVPMEARKIPMLPLMRAEVQAVFEAWRTSPNRIDY
ncbi:MAG: nucleoside deaminase [Acidobacteriota bacterium]|nr:nucleoside deaminase [Acidobacteriota bacterium]